MQIRNSLPIWLLVGLLAGLSIYILLSSAQLAALLEAFSGGLTHRAALALALPVLLAGGYLVARLPR